MLLSLDISTTTIGVAMFLKESKDLMFADYIPLSKIKEETEFLELTKKVEELKKYLIQKIKVADYTLDEVIIEEPLKSSNNINTCMKLAKFNALCSAMIYEEFGVVPQYISVAEWRRVFGFKNHRGEDLKLKYFNAVINIYKDIQIEYNRNGNIKKEMFDETDAIAIGWAYLNQ